MKCAGYTGLDLRIPECPEAEIDYFPECHGVLVALDPPEG